MRRLLLILIMLGLPLSSFGETDAVISALEEFLDFAEYAEGAISQEQLDSIDGVELHLVDTRSAELYRQGHMPGAVNIEWREILAKREQLPEDRPVILYCDTGLLSAKAHFALRLLGHENVKVLSGGYDKWLLEQNTGIGQ